MGRHLTHTEFDSRTSRRFPRYPLDVHLSVNVFRSGENVSFWGRTSELGEDGLGATLTGELECGEVVSMELALVCAMGLNFWLSAQPNATKSAASATPSPQGPELACQCPPHTTIYFQADSRQE